VKCLVWTQFEGILSVVAVVMVVVVGMAVT
jgi:hypothetical protein